MHTDPNQRRIFVQIASYRDAECHPTVKDLFEKAAHPERVFVGICWQFDPEEDKDCFKVKYPRKEQVRVVNFDARDAKGAGWARAQAQSLWQGEEYTLQIQAHMRFEKGWDETLIDMLDRCATPKAVLTAWLPSYTPPNRLQTQTGDKITRVRILTCTPEDDAQFMHLEGLFRENQENPTEPILCCSWIGNFLFAKSSALQEVRPDPHIYFWGEELDYSARLWTHGYDIYQCDKIVAYHYWCRNKDDAKDQDTYRDSAEPRNVKSLRRLKHRLRLELSTDKDVLEDNDFYPLGLERSIEQYFGFIGVNLKRRVVEPKGMLGQWTLDDVAPRKNYVSPSKERIFICMASYRDPEWQHTVNDMFKKAKDSTRVFAGVCLQASHAEDKELFNTTLYNAWQIRIKHVHFQKTKGANWARAQAFKLWQGEEYVLVIDSHMRFEKGWDEMLINQLKRCPSDKSLLTAWVPGYKPPNVLDEDDGGIERLRISAVGRDGDAQFFNLNFYKQPAKQVLNRIDPACALVANCTFGPSAAFTEVPFDPFINFWGDEINQSARLWTHGWNFFQLDRRVLYHYWDPVTNKDRNVYRDRQSPRHAVARMRNLHLFGIEHCNKPGPIRELAKFPLGTERTIEQYWDFVGLDVKTMTLQDFAKNGRWKIPGMKKPQIFVNIASFRDPEISPTLKDMFAKAMYPGRIMVGVCLQVDTREDTACLVETDRPGQVRIKQFTLKESKGANWARAEAQSLWAGEEYVLQIDSHMRFEQGWDEALVEMLNKAPSEKPVLSTYVPRYTPPDTRVELKKEILRIRVHMFGEEGSPQLLHLTKIPIPLMDKQRSGLYASPFYIANFMFCRASTLKEVPFDPHIVFWGDEITMAARLWTHGYDIYQPDKVVIYHYWRRDELVGQQGYRRMGNKRSDTSLARVRHVLGLQESHDSAVTKDIEQYGLGSARQLADLWEFAGINWQKHSISKDALEGRWNMAAKKKPAGKPAKTPKINGTAPPAEKLPRIFVSIASYRDPDCQNTVKDLFDKAAHPERITVGICWQFIKEEDEAFFKVPYPYPGQVKVIEIDARESKGVCWARAQIQTLYSGEDYALQIDSHMRFEPGWDDMLLSMWDKCGSDKAMLTCYPPGFTPPDTFERKWVFGMAGKEFDKDGIFLMHGRPAYSASNPPDAPMPGAFASGCMLFGPGRWMRDVPYDPYIYFFGEEISVAVRLWTHGYDFFHPNQLVIFHDWDRTRRKTHFTDHTGWGERNINSFARVRHLLGVERARDPEVTAELELYGLGGVRTLAEYQDYSGVNFAKKTISDKALAGVYQPYAAKIAAREPHFAIGKPRKKDGSIFINIASYRDPECQWTVKDLFEKAKNPDNIHVGICWQFDEKEDEHCFEVSTRPDQVRIHPIDWREAEGVCWARYQTQRLWDGEEYNLMIDSHMRFAPGWDELMIDELRACPADKPVISCSPTPYLPPDKLAKQTPPTIRRVKPFMPDGNIRCQGEVLDRVPEVPLNAAFVVANYVFSRSNIIEEVTYDPYLYFDQEEITYAARLYTHGWDAFSARKQFLYHYYNDNNVPGGSVRPLHWNDLRKEDNERIRFLRDRGLNRFNHMTGYRPSKDPEVTRELDLYGFGNVRTLAQFEDYSGIDFKRKVASEKALRGLFIKDLKKYRDRPVFVPEIDGKPGQPGMAPPKQPDVAAPKTPKMNGAGGAMNGTAHVAAAPAGPLKMLELGDFMPLFEVPDTNHKTRAIEIFGGKFSMVVFLPQGERDYIDQFFRAFHAQMGPAPLDMWQLFVVPDSVANLVAMKEVMKLPYVLAADEGHKIAHSFGLMKPGEEMPPVGYIVNRNLQVVKRHLGLGGAELATAMIEDSKKALEEHKLKYAQPRVFTEVAPTLIVPNAFTPEFCEKCIHAFRTGRTFEGTVGAGEKLSYRPEAKVRTDYIVHGELLDEIDEKLSRSLFPEIKKVFGFDVLHRERYKIGLYTGEKGGFFRAHRDNFDDPLGYRRIAMTLHLSDDYEGGGLNFPEYGQDVYRPTKGSAIAFSCSTLHEALPVTKGERFVVVGFFHGDEDEAFRRFNVTSKGEYPKVRDYIPALRPAPDYALSRDFFTAWRKSHVNFNAPAQAPGLLPAEPMTRPAELLSQKVTTVGAHQPKKVFESRGAVIFDDFLPEETYQAVYDHALKDDYEFINTGKVTRAWHVHDGHPLRNAKTEFYYAKGAAKSHPALAYPVGGTYDRFVEHLLAMQPHVQALTGKEGEHWQHFSVSSWLYPPGTGLSLHDDGSGVYSGAYVYFLNPVWKPHWGGLLLLADEQANKKVHEQRESGDQFDFYQRNFLHANSLDETIMEQGFAQCVLPKKNRIVFIANDAYHMVTRVNETAGDNLRMTLAGFFEKKK